MEQYEAGAPSLDDCWYVVHCKPTKEAFASSSLRENVGLVTYLPQVKQSFSGQTKPTPFFPGYIFVQANLREVQLSHINAAPGVIRLLQFGDQPRAVPATVVEALRKRVDDLNAQGGLPRYNFNAGDAVVLKSGPLRGLQAVFVGPMPARTRVKVLLEFLGRLNEVQVDAEALEPVRPDPVAQRGRTTRGKGRVIRRIDA